MAAESGKTLVLYHIAGMRSTRSLWLYYELKALYGDRPNFPELKLELLDRATFRTDKPKFYLELNPNGKVPTLVDGDIVMWDGIAICNYLLERYDFDGILSHPGDWKFRATFHKLSFYESNTVDQLTAYSSFIQRVIKDPMPGKKPEVMADNIKFWNEVAGPILTKQLGGRKFLYGDKFSALDVIVGTQMITHIRKYDDDFHANFPELRAYAAALKENENYKKSIEE